MALQINPHSESGRTDQIISQFLLKSLHVILDSRIPALRPRDPSGDQTPVSRARKIDKWFNLALGDRPAALENLNFWHRNVMDPMIIDVILIQEGVRSSSSFDDLYNSSSRAAMTETIIERWVVHYECQKTIPQSGDVSASYKKTYKKSIILLRSLYSTLRLLPAFRVFRQLTSYSQSYNFDISYKVSSFSEPFSRAMEEEMKSYGFAHVETPFGRLCVSVTYRPSLSDLNLGASTLFPPQIIMDYVGSPAADPLKIFPSLDKSIPSTSFPVRGFRSPSSSPFQRPHSWTSGIHRATHLALQPFGVSPPTYPTPHILSDFRPSPPDLYGHRNPNYRPSIHKKGISFDECRLSPPFSPSLSPSPPAYLSGGSPLQNRLRSESAPLSIPLPTTGRSTRYLTPNSSDPNKLLLPPPSPRSTRADLSSQESPSENKSFRKLDAIRAGEITGPKVFKDGTDDSGRFSGVVSSNGSPRIGVSRSSSRLSFQDDLDDCEFACPFAVDDVDTSDSQTRMHHGKDASESTQMFPSGRQSHDASVGILVQMLRTAPPLRQDQTSTLSSKSEFNGEVGASGFFCRKTADALEELRSYREMKDLLLSQSGTQLLAAKQRTK